MSGCPDFSPTMLRTFLFARQLTRDGFAGHPIKAKRDLTAELVRLSGLPESAVLDAFRGKLKDAGQRAALWAALGYFPSDHGVVFDDRGGQSTPRQAQEVAR